MNNIIFLDKQVNFGRGFVFKFQIRNDFVMWILTILFPTAESDAVSASWRRHCHPRRYEVVPSRHLKDHLMIHLYRLARRNRG